MSINYILIDFENVQPKNLHLLKDKQFKVVVFVGANQNKVPFELASAMQSLGEGAEYIKISSSGKNALDFHITYYLGKIVADDPKAYFHVISKDKGFDPLIKHLQQNKIKATRSIDVSAIPPLQIPASTAMDDKIKAIIKNLKGRGQSRPRKLKTLSNSINSIFTDNLSPEKLTQLIDQLKKEKLISINENGNVIYNLK